MSFDLSALKNAVSRQGRVARVVVAEAKGSTPRETGAAMLIWADGEEGTIGGGALELEALKQARKLLVGGGGARIDRVALGPELQQCCGGFVTLVTEVWDAISLEMITLEAGLFARAVLPGEMPLAVRKRLKVARGEGGMGKTELIQTWMVEPITQEKSPLWIWGGGHVGRALVSVLAPLPNFALTWVDTDQTRFPAIIPEHVEHVVASDLTALVPFAPKDAQHLILTYSHVLDLALCHALLNHGFSKAGLIGSATKWARFRKRLGELGHIESEIARIDCPIGDPVLGKHPQAIAISTAAGILEQRRMKTSKKKKLG